MARTPQQPEPAEQSTTLAEGMPVPTGPVVMSAEAVAATQAAPTPADYAREHGTYRAVVPLTVGTVLAVPAGGTVGASHPMLRDSDEVDPETGQGGWGQGWVSSGAVKLTGDYDAPDDLRAAHEAYADAQKALQAPGAGTHPGA
jgi:hypothetical protein